MSSKSGNRSGVVKQTTAEDILTHAMSYVRSRGSIPSVHDLARYMGVIRSSMRHHFNDDEELRDALILAYPQIEKELISMEDLSLATFQKLTKKAKTTKRFFITSAEVGKAPWNEGKAIETVLQWCKKRNALPLLIPIGNDVLTLHKAFKNFGLVLHDLHLNSNVLVTPVQASITAQNPAAGLSKISGQNRTSTIFGSTKLSKSAIPTDMGKFPHFLLSTGCLTNADYQKYDKLMPTKAQYIAEQDHEISGIIVEVKGDKTFFTKIVMFDTDGSFIEVSKAGPKRYFPNGKVKAETALNLNVGDSHVEEADPVAEAGFMEIARITKPEEISLHDVFSYEGPGHHTKDDIIVQAQMFEGGFDVRKDLKLLNTMLTKYSKLATKRVVIVDSNHDEHLEKAIKTFQLRQAATYRVFLELSLAMLDGHNTLEWGLKNYTGFKNSKVHFLANRERHVLRNSYGELALHHHGHVGANGAKGGGGTGKGSLAMSVGCANMGHTHSPCVIPGGSNNGYGNGGIWVNGTSTYINEKAPGYVQGAGSWCHTSTLTFWSGGKGRFLRTQVDLIHGEWCLD